MTKILAIDTSHNHCSVALNCDGIIQAAVCMQARQHARRLLPMIEEILRENALNLGQLDAIAFVNGPGSFTGLRIGAGVAQGLGFGANVPVFGVSSLAVMAFKARQQAKQDYFFVSMRAREGEVYAATYHFCDDDVLLLGREVVAPPLAVDFSAHVPDDAQCCAVGDGWGPLPDSATNSTHSALIKNYIVECYSDAEQLSKLALVRFSRGLAIGSDLALPVYLQEQMDYQD